MVPLTTERIEKCLLLPCFLQLILFLVSVLYLKSFFGHCKENMMIKKENSLTIGTINAIILVVPFWITVAVITTIIFK